MPSLATVYSNRMNQFACTPESTQIDTHRTGQVPLSIQRNDHHHNQAIGTEQHGSRMDEATDSLVPLQSGIATTSNSYVGTPSSTPTTQRKNRRISNLFQRPKDLHQNHHDDKSHRSTVDVNMGMGRVIPVKQGHLYKRSSKSLNKEWKKKYVCLHSDGRLSYHHTLKDYMEKDACGKEVFLGLATVRVAARQRLKVAQRSQTQPVTSFFRETPKIGRDNRRDSIDPINCQQQQMDSLSSNDAKSCAQECRLYTEEVVTPGDGTSGGSDDQQLNGQQPLSANMNSYSVASMATPGSIGGISVKKKKGHRRLGSTSKNEDEEDCEFEVVTCDQKRWEFSAISVDERNDWVSAIEKLIEKTLQKQQNGSNGQMNDNSSEIQALRLVPGNDVCADCGAPAPAWASLNLGTLICIECSGIHRNLGSHISKVRSLELDHWPLEYLSVMLAVGNRKANATWEHGAPMDRKPKADSCRDEKELWIKMKYELKQFLPQVSSAEPLGRQLLAAVFENNLDALLAILPRCSTTDLQTTVDANDRRSALHIACSNASATCTQLLVWYNADLGALDDSGRSALWHAQMSGATDCASILISAGIDPVLGVSDKTGKCFTTGAGAGQTPSSAPTAGGTVIIRDPCKSSSSSSTDEKLTHLRKPKARRQSDMMFIRRALPNLASGASSRLNGLHQRTSEAFERLPASVI